MTYIQDVEVNIKELKIVPDLGFLGSSVCLFGIKFFKIKYAKYASFS